LDELTRTRRERAEAEEALRRLKAERAEHHRQRTIARAQAAERDPNAALN